MGRVLVSGIYPLADELRAPFLSAVGTRLASDVALLTLLGGPGVHVGADPADKPANGRWLTVAFEKPNGAVPEDLQGWLTPRLWIKSECRRSAFASYVLALAWHTDVAAAVAARLLGYSTSLAGGVAGGTGQVVEREEASDDLLYDANDDTYFFASFYSTRIIAAHAA